MPKCSGFSVPLVLLFVAFFLSLPLLFWAVFIRPSAVNIKGISTVSHPNSNLPGILLEVSSDFGTWDLVSYLCKSKEECTADLNAGARSNTFSGGVGIGYKYLSEYSETWGSYKYLKVFVTPGWGSQNRTFKVVSTGEITGSELVRLNSEVNEFETVLIPLEFNFDRAYQGPKFSDK